jgi:adenosylmethionine-8-amino-7-oxononanoate aminotransferase
MTRDAIYRAFYDSNVSKAFLHSHSYTGNPLACSAALATLAIFREDQTLKANKQLSQAITNALRPLQSDSRVKHFRNQGMIWAFDAQIEDPLLRETFSRRFFASALKHEMLLRPIGTTVYLMPPYILNDAEVTHLAQRTLAVFDEVMG